MKSEVFFLGDRIFYNIESTFFVAVEVTADCALHVPRSSVIYGLASHGKRIVDDTFL